MKQIEFTELQANAAELIGQRWMLISAGTPDKHNCMTASWGGLGFMWNRPVAFVVVRPNRYSREFIDAGENFCLNFMPESYRDDLIYCGRHSGRDGDKFAATKLIPCPAENGSIRIEDADIVLQCRKLYRSEMKEADFLAWGEVSPKWYNDENPLHILYICEISACLVRD